MPIEKYLDVEVQVTTSLAAYAANDVVGGLLSFNVATITNGGILNRLKLRDADNIGAVFDCYIFNEQPTIIADNNPAAFVASDLDKLITVIPIAAADYRTINSLKIAIRGGIENGLNIAYIAPNAKLYAYLVSVGAPTFLTATALKASVVLLTS